MGDNIFEQFLDFFNAVLTGNHSMSIRDQNEEVLNTLRSSSTMNALNYKVYDILKDFTSEIEQSVYADSNITIDCSPRELNDFELTPMGQRFTWWGEEIPNSKCIQYGCCYDVTQSANIRLAAINSVSTEHHAKMLNTIEQELRNQVQVRLGENSDRLSILTSAMNSIRTTSRESIEKIIQNLSLTEVEVGQDIKIKPLSPLRCKNKCTEEPTAGFVDQYFNVHIAVENIINDVTNTISETYIRMTNHTDITASNVDITLIYTFAFLSCILIITIYIISYIIVYFLLRAAASGAPPPSIAVYIGAFILTIIILSIWSIIVCLIRGNGVFCMFR
tara:strand:- start:1614 stop:2612 length:999 start_codon:yes stop_codon:yes gene_type:complete